MRATAFPPDYPPWRRAFARVVFPLVFCGGLGGAWLAIAAGYDPRLVAAFTSVAAAVCVIAAEKIQPHADRWARSHGDVRTDAAHVVFSEVVPFQLVDTATRVLLLPVAVALAEHGGALWPSQWIVPAQILLTMAVSELGYYWWHRLCHTNAWFWRFHATHHSAPRLYWLNAARFHPLDAATGYALNVAPLIVLGAPPEMLAMFTVWTTIHGLFQHANIELRLGWLNYLFSMAEVHRWHHSRMPSDHYANFGGNVILWDLVFGTFHFPRDRRHAPEDVGFEGDEGFPTTYIGQLASVFGWERATGSAPVRARAELRPGPGR